MNTARSDTVLRPVTPVGILADRLAGLATRIGTDGELGRELAELAALAGGLDPYVERCTTSESPALADLAAGTRDHDWAAHNEPTGAALGLEAEMLSGHVEGRLLATLVHVMRARRVLEIGTFTGYATLAMAEALPDDGVVVTCELDPAVADAAQEAFARSAAGARIDVRVGAALDTVRSLAGGAPFDLVFVDADKAGYRDYVSAVLDHGLLAPHGLIAVDNTLMQGQPWTATSTANGRAIAAFNDAVAADPRVEQVLVPVRDGLTLIRHASDGGS